MMEEHLVIAYITRNKEKNSVSNQQLFLIFTSCVRIMIGKSMFPPLEVFLQHCLGNMYFRVVQTENIFSCFLKSHTVYTGNFCLS